MTVTPWNGVVDSAASLTSDTKDIVMLANGKERFAGKINALTDQTLNIHGSYAEMTIPQTAVADRNAHQLARHQTTLFISTAAV